MLVSTSKQDTRLQTIYLVCLSMRLGHSFPAKDDDVFISYGSRNSNLRASRTFQAGLLQQGDSTEGRSLREEPCYLTEGLIIDSRPTLCACAIKLRSYALGQRL